MTSLCEQKPGKWCAMHVRVAWMILRHQEKVKVSPSMSKLIVVSCTCITPCILIWIAQEWTTSFFSYVFLKHIKTSVLMFVSVGFSLSAHAG